ncbi:MAG: hypothetical protein IBJ03_02160 [Gemmatimonadaceae bacterium]|nr:hypothetical protein [Gemmatimonadaceae bacterium]
MITSGEVRNLARFELIQGTHREVIREWRTDRNRVSAYDVRLFRYTRMDSVGTDVISRLRPGPAVLRLTVFGGMKLLRTPAPRIREIQVEIASAVVQDPREVVLQMLRGEAGFDPRTQFVQDDSELLPYVTCRGRQSARRCMLTDTVPVMRVSVHMLSVDSARVSIGQYRMFSERCPSRVRIDPPVIGLDGSETRIMTLRAGQWTDTGRRQRIAC